ncbi:DUF4902 domain-containing protein [Variovorax terrae]|uniref:DUF4902 domain-containing protein n=1 Tax=Variovorax terrae TaxID=2923278 RepID=A0A9X2APD8_9BURK|nr:DUF4902 domain-containing protein [Variovorax terrae]MCJ0765289.1 DUF4902 domain-containing protein [Variovorax terrae]
MNSTTGAAFGATPPQLHSGDYRVRIGRQALEASNFAHLHTGCDRAAWIDNAGRPGQRPAFSGFTEWSGTVGQTILSLGWDWLSWDGKAICTSPFDGPRSNIMVIDAQGYDLDVPACEQHLRALIDRLAWRKAVQDCINEESITTFSH